jgi:AcrR family transcriptional regulator
MNDAGPGGGRQTPPAETADPLRGRVLRAAFSLFHERGFSGTSMLEIATRAQVSKRDLYALFDNKHALLADAIAERAQGMRQRLGSAMPVPASREELSATLVEIGASILRTVCSAEVLMMYRLAIAESDRAPEVGRALDDHGREANHRALAEFLEKARKQGLIGSTDPDTLVKRYGMALWSDDLLIRLLLRVRDTPTAKEIKARAQAATEAVMR